MSEHPPSSTTSGGPACLLSTSDRAPGGVTQAGPPLTSPAAGPGRSPGNTAVVMGVVRHVLTLAAGYLVTRGTLGEGDVEPAVGAVCALLAIGWSIHEKQRATRHRSTANPGTIVPTLIATTIALLGVLLLSAGCASASRVVTADIRLQCGTNIVTVSQPKDTVIDSLEFDPVTGRLVLRGYQSTASAAAVESARAQAAIQGQVISAGLGVIESLAARAAQSQGVPLAPKSAAPTAEPSMTTPAASSPAGSWTTPYLWPVDNGRRE